WYVAPIRLFGRAAADAAEWLEKFRKFGPADGDSDAIVTLGQGTNHMTAEKARAARDSGQSVSGAACGHAALNSLPGGCCLETRPIQDRPGTVQYQTRFIDKLETAPYLVPTSPGGGIGRRTSFRY